MKKILIMLAAVCALTACAGSLPTCDGEDRRPINAPAKAEVVYPSCGVAA